MERNYISHNQQQNPSEVIAQPLVQQICTWAVVLLLLIVVFSLLGARIIDLYHQFASGSMF